MHASIGVAIATAPVDAEELLRRADAAMYWAKVQGKGGYEVYDAGMIEGSGRRLLVRTELERALPTATCACTTSRSSSCAPVSSTGSRPWFAGSTPSGAGSSL